MISRALALTASLLYIASPSPSPDPTRDKVFALAPKLTAEDQAEQQRAEKSLLGLGNAAVEPLLEVAKKEPGPVTYEIGRVLSRMGPDAIETIALAARKQSKSHPYHQDHAWRVAAGAVAGMREAAVPKLTELFTRQEQRFDSRVFASSVFQNLGPLAVEPLVGLLKHADHDVRSEAAATLAYLADPRSADALLEGLGSEDGDVQLYSARGMAKLQDRRAIEPLLGLLKHDHWSMRENAAVALGRMYEPRFATPLLELAKKDPEPMVRRTAANILLRESKDPAVLREARRYQITRLPTAADAIYREILIVRTTAGVVFAVLALLGTLRGFAGAACAAVTSLAAAALGVWSGPQTLVPMLVGALLLWAVGPLVRLRRTRTLTYWRTVGFILAGFVVGGVIRAMALAGRSL